MDEQKLTINRPQGVTTGYNTFRHVHDKERRKRDYKVCKGEMQILYVSLLIYIKILCHVAFSKKKLKIQRIGDQKKDQFSRDREGGYDNVDYELIRTDHLTIGGAKVTVVNVELKCNKEKTPWCEG